MFFTRSTSLAVTLLALFLCPAAMAQTAQEPAADKSNSRDKIDFVRDVRPILVAHCYDCHGEKKQRSGLRLDVKSMAFKGGDYHAPNIIPGKSAQSPLIQFVRGEDEEMLMPPKGKGLTEKEIATLARWIDEGANWPDGVDTVKVRDRRDHWAFKPMTKPKQPQTKTKEWPRNDVDRFVLARLEQAGLKPAPETDRLSWLRRVHMTLTGLPPSPKEVAAFLADERGDAHARVVDHLLASPRYGERWAQHWLDIIRYADTHGFEVNTPRDHAWPYRDYVIGAFNEDKPYDRFIREQLVGEGLEADAATGFLVSAAALLPGQIGQDDVSKRQARQDELDEIVIGVSGSLLGLTMGCARCHDHKFDPISHRDYFAFQAFFAGVEYGDRPLHDSARRDKLAKAQVIAGEIDRLEAKLHRLEPYAFTGRTLIIDEEDKSLVTHLKKPNGPGVNPPGASRGYRDDVGSATREGNISGGRYTWWNNTPTQDVLTYNPGVAGHHRLWLSWGVHGSGVHTRDARYLLDRDGDLATIEDQRELAKVDQYHFAGVTQGTTEMVPLWSGLRDVGVVELTEASKIILRGGETGTGITADVIVLQQVMDAPASGAAAASLPRLRAPVSAQRNVEMFPATQARFVRFTTLATINDNEHQPCIDELEIFTAGDQPRNLALASSGATATSSGNYPQENSHQLKHINDGQYGNEKSWISSEYGKGWVQIEFKEQAAIDRVIWARDRTGKYSDRLAQRYRIDVSLDGRTWTTVASSDDRITRGTPHDPLQMLLRNQPEGIDVDLAAVSNEIAELQGKKRQLETPQLVFAGRFRKPDETRLLRRGDPEQPAEKVSPAVPQLFGLSPLPDDLPEQDRRRRLADWIASPQNPLTARVMVNRIWQHHFGAGLVSNTNDFGRSSPAPSHPELLDWLAQEFIASGWSVKHVQRLITLSSTFRQANRIDTAAAAIDGDNRLLWHYSSRRIEAEALRDSILAVTGELNLQTGGPGFNFFQSRGGLTGFPPLEKFGPQELRRMIYAHKVRMEEVPVFGAFDCPDAGQMAGRRNQSTTAIQALNLFNSEFIAQRAQSFAARIKAAKPGDIEAQVTLAYELTLGRPPTAVERAASVAAVSDHDLELLGRVLFNSSEFLFIP